MYTVADCSDTDFHSVLLLSAPSAPVQEVTVSVESPSAVKVSWLPPNPQTWNGLIVNYTVTYKLLGPVDTNLSNSTVGVDFALALPSPGLIPANSLDPRVASLPIRTETVIVDNLHEYHVYEFAVYLANSAGRSELSNPILQELPATGTSDRQQRLSSICAYISSERG